MAEFDGSHYTKMLDGCIALAKSSSRWGDHKKLEAIVRLAYNTGAAMALEHAVHDDLNTEQLFTRFKAQTEIVSTIMETEVNV